MQRFGVNRLRKSTVAVLLIKGEKILVVMFLELSFTCPHLLSVLLLFKTFRLVKMHDQFYCVMFVSCHSWNFIVFHCRICYAIKVFRNFALESRVLFLVFECPVLLDADSAV